MNEKLALNDISIVPCVTTDIKSRSECIPYLYNNSGLLPLFTAPMSTVVEEKNLELFYKNKITPILPRNVCFKIRKQKMYEGYWVAYGLEDIEKILKIDGFGINPHILIDVANGHMECIYDLVRDIRKRCTPTIMVGNIANPETYLHCCQNNIDYVRIGIGGGQNCLTASNTGVFYPTASLILEIIKIRKEKIGSGRMPTETKIVADGCAKGYSDIIKALALGADYVMCGKLFAKMLETPGNQTLIQTNGMSFVSINQYDFDFKTLKDGEIITKDHYGMSTKRAQKEWCSPRLKTAEGKEEKITIEYTMSQWVENFTDYLCSSMAYTGKKTIEDFIGGVEIIRLSENASTSYNK